MLSFSEFVNRIDAGEVDSVVVYELENILVVANKGNTDSFCVKYDREYLLTEKLLDKGITLRSTGYGRSKGTENMEDVSFNEFISMVEKNAVEEVALNPKYSQAIVTSSNGQKKVSVYYLEDFPLSNYLQDHNVRFTASSLVEG